MLGLRKGITAVELIAVIVALGILSALLLIALRTGRTPVRTAQCRHHLKHLSLAALQHEDIRGHFPGFVSSFGTWTGSEQPADPSDPDADTSTFAPHRKVGTWIVALLPWMEEQPTYEHWTQDEYPIAFGGSAEFPLSSGDGGEGFHFLAAPNLPLLQCPADPIKEGSHGRNSYVCNAGMYHRNLSLDTSSGLEDTWTLRRGDGAETEIDFARSMTAANGVFNNKFAGRGHDGMPVPVGPKVSLSDFVDGLGNTILVSENLQAVPWHRAGLIDASNLQVIDDQEVRFDETSRYTQGIVWHYEDAALIDGTAVVKPIHRINGTHGTDRIYELRMTRRNAAELARPSSMHADGVNAGMADGATRFISDTIDYRVYQALLTPDGMNSDAPVRDTPVSWAPR